MIKQRFKIRYEDPDDQKIREIEKEFQGNLEFTPREWAEDYAYSLSDKGWYRVTEIKTSI